MTRIIIDDVDDIQDLYNALAAVTQVFTKNLEKFDSDEEYFSKGPNEACECDDCLRSRLTERQPIAEIATPTPYIPCPDRGNHLRLTDCWACWCDVHRGACLEVDVLAPEAWDIAAAALLPAARRHRADGEPLTTESEYVGRHRADVVEGAVVSDEEVA